MAGTCQMGSIELLLHPCDDLRGVSYSYCLAKQKRQNTGIEHTNRICSKSTILPTQICICIYYSARRINEIIRHSELIIVAETYNWIGFIKGNDKISPISFKPLSTHSFS